MLKMYRGLKIRHKLIAVFAFICVLSVTASSLNIYFAAARNLDERTESFATAMNRQVVSNMENFMSSYKGLIMAVLVDSDVLAGLSKDPVDIARLAENRPYISRLLSRLVTMQPNIIYAGIILNNGQSFQTGTTGEQADIPSLLQKDWIREIMESGSTFSLIPMHAGEYTNRFTHNAVITVVQKLYGPSRQNVGMIVLDTATSSVVDLGDTSVFEHNVQGIRVVVEDSLHRVIYDSAHGSSIPFEEDGFLYYSEPGSDYRSVSEELPDTGITVHTLYPESALMLRRRDMLIITALTVLLCIGFAFLCAVLFSRSFTGPILKLRLAFKDMENECYRPVSVSFNRDEVGDLIRDYNHMAERFGYLVQEVYRTNLQKKNAQLLALQTQINPHMLFNTLESIRMKALVAGNRDVARMTRLLAKMFRMSLENVNENHTVRDELDYVQSFMELQNLRFRVENVLEIDVSEELMDVPCMVILFQPIVENSLSHGRIEDTNGMRIRIQGRRDGEEIVFSVSDNGTGMEAEQLLLISDRLEAIRSGSITMNSYAEDGRQHIGLENIAKRLQLQYGSSAGLRVAYSTEEGTCIEIRILDLRDTQPSL